MPNEQPSLFLSYASTDREFAIRLAMDVQAGGAKVWIDQEEMRLGDVVVERLSRAISQADFFAVILSPAALASEWVRKEVEIALWRETDATKSQFLPLLYQKCELPSFLKDRVYADFTRPNSYSECVAQILQRLGLDSGAKLLIYDLGGGTIDTSVIRIKEEFMGKVDVEALAHDLQALGRKHERKIKARGTNRKQGC